MTESRDRIARIDQLLKFIPGKFCLKWEVDIVEQLLKEEKERCLKWHECMQSFPTKKIDDCCD